MGVSVPSGGRELALRVGEGAARRGESLPGGEVVDRGQDLVLLDLVADRHVVAGQLAKAGLDVIGIESELVGGECPYWGCIPSKMMIRAANLLAEARRIPGMAGSVSGISPDWASVAEQSARKPPIPGTTRWRSRRFLDAGGHFIRGQATILDSKRVQVGEQVITVRQALVITAGTSAAIPPIPGLAGAPYWTNREAIATETLPASLLVIGAGAIGCEIGQTFARFGVDVAVADAADRALPLEEPESGAVIAEVFAKEGIGLHLGVGIERVEHSDNEFRVFRKGDTTPLRAEKLLIATGRRVRVDQQTWDALGLTGRPGPLPVNDRLRVVDGVWAAGDIAGKGAFTHMATYHADIVVRDVDKPAIQYVVEEAAAAGLTDLLMITGRSKRALEDHFDRNAELEAALEAKGDEARLAAIRVSQRPRQGPLRTPGRPARPRPRGADGRAARRQPAVRGAARRRPDRPARPAAVGDDRRAEARGGSVVALMEVPRDQIHLYGCAAVEALPDSGSPDVVRITGLVEKPATDEAPSNLAIIGRYVLDPAVFAAIRRPSPVAAARSSSPTRSRRSSAPPRPTAGGVTVWSSAGAATTPATGSTISRRRAPGVRTRGPVPTCRPGCASSSPAQQEQAQEAGSPREERRRASRGLPAKSIGRSRRSTLQLLDAQGCVLAEDVVGRRATAAASTTRR